MNKRRRGRSARRALSASVITCTGHCCLSPLIDCVLAVSRPSRHPNTTQRPCTAEAWCTIILPLAVCHTRHLLGFMFHTTSLDGGEIPMLSVGFCAPGAGAARPPRRRGGGSEAGAGCVFVLCLTTFRRCCLLVFSAARSLAKRTVTAAVEPSSKQTKAALGRVAEAAWGQRRERERGWIGSLPGRPIGPGRWRQLLELAAAAAPPRLALPVGVAVASAVYCCCVLGWE